MKPFRRLTCLITALFMVAGLCLTACSRPGVSPGADDSTGSPPSATEEYTEPLKDGYNQLTFYWSYSGSYENCDMWIWFPNQDGKGYVFHECEYGGKVVVNVPEGIEEVGFIVRRDCSDPGGTAWGSATKDYDQDRFAKIEGRETVV